MTKKEITRKHAKAYAHANKKTKGQILDSICLVTNWSRDNARRQLKNALKKQYANNSVQIKKTKPFKYSSFSRIVLANAWLLSGLTCGVYLKSQIDNGLLERLILHKELRSFANNKGPLVSLNDYVLTEIKAMSSATIDRYLKATKAKFDPLSASTTKQASYPLRNEIPFGKSYTEHKEPGWLSTDTVAHCGHSLKGDHIWTVNSTDTVTGWTETISIPSRASRHVKEAHENLLPRFPFEIKGVNYDGGSEFINRDMINYANLQHYQMTRSRPYHSNDNAHAEQKNAEIVRKYAFRFRYNGDLAMHTLNKLWFWVNLRKNYLIPTRKCIGHTKTKSGRTRGIYDSPKTPAKRVLESDIVSNSAKEKIKATLLQINDALVTRKILDLQEILLGLALDHNLKDFISNEIMHFSPA